MGIVYKTREEKYEVVIVGGGMTGLCAAIAAARHGARTALVQDRPVFGGNASSEVRMHICGASENQKKPELNEGGILHELLLKNKYVNDSFCYSIWDAVLFEAARHQQGLTLYLNTTMYGAEAEEKRVTAIHCYQMTTELHLTLRADIFVDSTGNGTLGAFVGVPFRTGSEAKAEFGELHAPEEPNNCRMGNTLLFKAQKRDHPVKFIPPVTIRHFSDDDLKLRKHAPQIPPEVLATATPEEIRMMFDGYCPDYGFWWIELPGESPDIIDDYEKIRDELVAAVYGIWDHIKNHDGNAADYELTWVGIFPGMRESRRMEGDYILTENDILANRRFEDVVAYGGWQVDNHVPGGLNAKDELPALVYEFDGSYDIPYRCYLARDFENLYVSGRSLSASKLGMASTRVMGTCAIGGQAIGTAAAQAIRAGCDIRAVDMKELQQTRLRDDCYLPGLKNEDPLDLLRTATVTASSQQAEHPAENLLSGVTRAIDGAANDWRSDGLSPAGEWIEFHLEKPAAVRTVQLVFDSNFDYEKKITLSGRRQSQQVPGVPRELVRDFTVELLREGRAAASVPVTGNYLRLRRVALPGVECDAVRVRVTATNGLEEARVFEVRAYAINLD